MAIFGRSRKNNRYEHPLVQHPVVHHPQEYPSSAIPIPYNSPQQHSYFPPQPEFPSYGTPSPWVQTPYQPYKVTVSQTYLMPQQSPPTMSSTESGCPRLAKLKAGAVTVTNLLQGDVPECIPGARIFNEAHYFPVWQNDGNTENLTQTAALYDLISSKLDAVVTMIDGERFSGDERELDISQPSELAQELDRSLVIDEKGKRPDKSKGGPGCPITCAINSANYFAKVDLYANSRLPLNLPPLKLYIATYQLLGLAANYSERVYAKPKFAEKETHVEADFRMGTKAMVIKSVPMDDMATIVFAIRGSQTFMDWAVNLKTAPSSPENLLDDPGNLCHSGFLSVARRMIRPVAERLHHLLSELHNGQRRSTKNYSLLITGHSAGGAVASLLYSHMLSTTPETASILRDMTAKFKRIHCITFGAPPISLLPLTKPPGEKLKKSLFLSFVNEGDPVARADKKYIRSLLDLYATPAPMQNSTSSGTTSKLKPWATGQSTGNYSDPNVNIVGGSKGMFPNMSAGSLIPRPNLPLQSHSAPPLPVRPPPPPIWPVPESELSNAGRIVVLRSASRYGNTTPPKRNPKQNVMERMNEGVIAQTVTDEQLRGVIWGDPVCHMMGLYKRRIEILATNAVMGKG